MGQYQDRSEKFKSDFKKGKKKEQFFLKATNLLGWTVKDVSDKHLGHDFIVKIPEQQAKDLGMPSNTEIKIDSKSLKPRKHLEYLTFYIELMQYTIDAKTDKVSTKKGWFYTSDADYFVYPFIMPEDVVYDIDKISERHVLTNACTNGYSGMTANERKLEAKGSLCMFIVSKKEIEKIKQYYDEKQVNVKKIYDSKNADGSEVYCELYKINTRITTLFDINHSFIHIAKEKIPKNKSRKNIYWAWELNNLNGHGWSGTQRSYLLA